MIERKVIYKNTYIYIYIFVIKNTIVLLLINADEVLFYNCINNTTTNC